MDTIKLADEFQGAITSIGRGFFFANYLPALLFVVLHQYVLLPALGLPDTLLPDVSAVPLLSGELLTTLLLPLFLAMLLMSLNTAIIKFFEGLFPWQQSFLLRWWQRANEQKSEQLYGELQRLKTDYRNLLEAIAETELAKSEESPKAMQSSGYRVVVKQLWRWERLWKWLAYALNTLWKVPGTSLESESNDPRESSGVLFDRQYQLEIKIQEIHEQIEDSQPIQTLPFRVDFVRPTALGNAFAVFGEYPLDRYGIDGVLFWPRLRQVVDENILSVLDNLKMFLDFQLNLSVLALIFAFETAGMGIVRWMAGWWVAAVMAFLVSWLAYSAGVRVVRTMGTLVNTCFDLYREKLLEQFGLVQPTNFFEEYKTWLRLGAFLRRGEIFYWPGDL